MKVLVTGASGFVGRAVVAALAADGEEVRAAVRDAPVSPFPSGVAVALHGDLAEPIDWMPLLAGIDAIVHLAGIAHAGPGIAEERYDRVNHLATAALANAARACGVARLVFVSSIRAQTGPAADHVVTESNEPWPTDPYGRSKLAAERAVARSGMAFTILRPVLVYGPGVKGNLRALMRLAALPLPLPFGALTARRSLVSLANLAGAIRFVLRHDACARETYVVADPAPVTIAEIVAALRHGIGRKPGLFAMPPALLRLALAGLGRGANWDQINGALVVDSAKLMAAGWQPDPDTKSALAAMVRGMNFGAPDEHSRSFMRHLLATYPEWKPFATIVGSSDDRDYLVVEVPAPAEADLASNLLIHTGHGEVTVDFDHYHAHYGWPVRHAEADPMAFIAAILNEEVAAGSGWNNGKWSGSWLVEKGQDPKPTEAFHPITRIRVRSWKGSMDLDRVLG